MTTSELIAILTAILMSGERIHEEEIGDKINIAALIVMKSRAFRYRKEPKHDEPQTS